jgi:hypothetical protein
VLVAQILIVLILSAIFFQDLKSRSVYWFWFPLLMVLFIAAAYGLHHKPMNEILASSLTNMGFILLQLLLVSLYFSIKNKRLINITKDLLGWGDVLFLLSIAFYLSLLNYILFYIFSLLAVLLLWLISLLFHKKHEQIPLAGLQAILFIVCLGMDWLGPQRDLTNDYWLTHYLLPTG